MNRVVACCVADVDNLGGGSDHPHIDVSSFMLCYLTHKWFTSPPCLREFVRAILRGTPMIAVLEPFTSDTYGGHTEDECRQIIASPEWYTGWQGMQPSVTQWSREWDKPGLKLPTAQEAEDALFASEPIVWSRLADFQDVTMRLLGERLVAGFAHRYDDPYEQVAYKQDELAIRVKGDQIQLLPLTDGCRFRLWCSSHNPGTLRVAEELQSTCKAVTFTSEIDELAECEHMIVLLTYETWTRGEASTAFAREVARAMRLGVHCLLIHEVPGARRGDNEARRACPFEHFFEPHTTPTELIKAGLYNESTSCWAQTHVALLVPNRLLL
jgi:hypothetical protein